MKKEATPTNGNATEVSAAAVAAPERSRLEDEIFRLFRGHLNSDAEAERLLAELKAERVEAEAQVRGMLAAAEEQARAYEAEAKVRLEESLVRRQMLAERKIANAEAQAEAEVRAAAVDLAARMAETVLADRLAGAKSDPLVDRAIPLIAEKLA